MYSNVWQNYIGRKYAGSSFYLLVTHIQRTLVSPFKSVGNTATVSVHALPVQCHYSAGTDVGRDGLEKTGNIVFEIMLLTWNECS